jgi:hypothetical protein
MWSICPQDPVQQIVAIKVHHWWLMRHLSSQRVSLHWLKQTILGTAHLQGSLKRINRIYDEKTTHHESVTCTLVTFHNPFIHVPRSTIPTWCYTIACCIYIVISNLPMLPVPGVLPHTDSDRNLPLKRKKEKQESRGPNPTKWSNG